MSDQQRAAWRCRRGMKELDLILGAWLKSSWDLASEPERAEFERFLELPDPLIADYLLGRDVPTEPATLALVVQLRRQRSG